jgi:hypothetical protein
MTLLVRDEADIVRQNIEFHLAQGVDYVVAIDNGSVDGTRDILSEFERLGVAAVVDEPGRDYAQAKWVTRAALMARDEFAADWILNNDADEFWWCPDGQLKSRLASAGAQMLICERRNMIYAYDEEENAPWLDRLVYRVELPVPQSRISDIYTDDLPAPYYYLALPPKVLVRAAGLRLVEQGNHTAEYDVDAEECGSDIRIYHYPVRSLEQFRKKVLQGGAAYLQNHDLPLTAGWHWRRWYRKIVEGGVMGVISEVLPSASRLKKDIAEGAVIEDRTIQKLSASDNI